jgi:tetratricopeptide (TPR) repeat protein
MPRWSILWFSTAVLAHGAAAAEIELTIAPPEPRWLLPPEISPGPCVLFGGWRLETCPAQLHPEGIVEVVERSLVVDLVPLLAAGDYEAVLSRIGLNYGLELVLLEAGDLDGFRRTRIPSAGGGNLRPPPGSRGRNVPSLNLSTDPSAVPLANSPGEPTNVQQQPQGGSGATRAGTVGLPPDTISASILYVIGHSYFSLQQYRPAESAFRLALDALPNHIRAHESLAMLYLRTERYAEAREHLGRVLELGRNTAHVYSMIGYLEQRTRRYSAAAAAFERALVLAPDDRGAHRGLLHALTATRDRGKARALVEQLLRQEPSDPGLWLYRASIALTAGERAAAVASLETALRLGDDSIANRQACAVLHLESGNVARAVELLRGPATRGLEFSVVDQALGWLENANRWEDFRALLASVDRETLTGAEQSRLATRRASLAVRDGNRRAASTALLEALTADPANPDALLALGRLHRAERDFGRADLMFRRASAYPETREAALLGRAELAIEQESFDGALSWLREVAAANLSRADLRRSIDSLENLLLLRTQR